MDFLKKLIKWAAIAFCALIVLGIIVDVFDSNEVEKKEETTIKEQEEKQEEKQKSFIGTYEVTDEVGTTIKITLKEDKSAVATRVGSENVTYYCSWIDFTNMNSGIQVLFSDKVPYLVFEGGDNKYKNGGCLKDGWYYATYQHSVANNPQWRIKAKKIN